MFAGLMLAALLLEMACGWPQRLYRLIRHPVVWMGALINLLDTALNRTPQKATTSLLLGSVSSLLVIAMVTGCALMIQHLSPDNLWGLAVQGVVASSLLASRSMYQHVVQILAPLQSGDINRARRALALIVGREVDKLDNEGICRGTLESLAENTSDGIVAPLFWGVLLGLPGIAAYKAVNTLDSMIGHRTPRYMYFGRFAARLDDVMNWLPARLTALLFAVWGDKPTVLRVIRADAGRHRSVNAGWPEAAMAGLLNVRLSGPRYYQGNISHEAWVNPAGHPADSGSLRLALSMYKRVMVLLVGLLAILCIIVGYVR